MPRFTPRQIAERRPVWLALSELFLDTDVRLFFAEIAKALAESPYTNEELRRILEDEVAPALQANLMVVAGEWAAFDEEWVMERILARQGQRRWLPLAVNLDRDWSSLSQLVGVMRSLPAEGDRRTRRASIWRALIPLFLDRDDSPVRITPPEAVSRNELEAVLREDLIPAMIDSEADLAAVERRWKQVEGLS